MPTTRITVALNAQQSQKAPLLLHDTASFDPDASDSCRALVLKVARTKLRLKGAKGKGGARVFVAGSGKELVGEAEWRDVLRDDVVLLVSGGEEYVGLRREGASGRKRDEREGFLENGREGGEGDDGCSIVNLALSAPVDPLSLAQLGTTARSLPGIVHAVGQPDLHPGTKFPIGAVFVSRGWIHPPLIGGDIGCGMAWYKTTLARSQVVGDKGRRVAEKLRGLEGAWRRREDRERWLAKEEEEEEEKEVGGREQTSMSAGEEWDVALGTIGAGNHFAELQVVEAYTPPTTGKDEDGETSFREGDVVLLVHSGSRGYGGDILKRYTAGGSVSMHESDPQAIEYMKEHDRACGWARKNRDLIALRFLACLEPGEDAWDLGVNDGSGTATAETIAAAQRNVQRRKVVDIWHNNVERASWPPLPTRPTSTLDNLSHATSSLTLTPSSPSISRPSDTTQHQSTVYIHRKGAAPTQHPTPSALPSNHTQPSAKPLTILPLPGSRGTPTVILHPLFPASTSHGLKNALSLAHGAGRAMSRAKASAYVAQKYKGRAEDLLRGDHALDSGSGSGNKGGGNWSKEGEGGQGVRGGTWVVCEEKSLVWEEAVEAYKDVFAVAEDLVREGVAECVGWCRGRVCYKVRKE